MPRSASIRRETTETTIEIALDLDGTGASAIDTPLPFFSHMLEAFARHALIDLRVTAKGDIAVDGHHTVEDVGLVLGEAVLAALGDRRGITRFGNATIPMDETLATAAIDLSGRPYFVWNVKLLDGRWVGGFDCELAREFFHAFATRALCNLHLAVPYGGNAHHVVESLFKACARALRMAAAHDPRTGGAVPSTKGTLSA